MQQTASINRTKLALGVKPMPFLVQMMSENSSSCFLITAFQLWVGTDEHHFTTEEDGQRPEKRRETLHGCRENE